jgi:hypothetical protein
MPHIATMRPAGDIEPARAIYCAPAIAGMAMDMAATGMIPIIEGIIAMTDEITSMTDEMTRGIPTETIDEIRLETARNGIFQQIGPVPLER